MNDRFMAYMVILDANYREDDAENIKQAISMIKGVHTVSPIVATPETYIAQERAKTDLLKKLFEVLK